MQSNNQERDNLLAGMGNVNSSDKNMQPLTESQHQRQKKKKMILIGAVAGVAVIALILGLTLGGSDGGDTPNPPPPPVPPVPPTPPGYNPYHVNQSSVVKSNDKISGIIDAQDDIETILTQSLLSQDMLRSHLNENGQPTSMDPKSIPYGQNNQIMKRVRFEFGEVDYNVANLMMTDDLNERFSPPEDLVKKPKASKSMRLDMSGLEVTLDPFSFSFGERSWDDKTEYLTTKDQALFLMDKYIQMDMRLPTQRIYGLGERKREFQLTEGTWTMWANGRETPYDDGTGGKQTYGVHPFVLTQTKTPGQFTGIYFRNSNAQSPIIKHKDDGTSVFSYISTGGKLDVYFFFKGSAKQIISMYQKMIGLPALPPFWALGWHASSYGYQTLDDVKENVQGYANLSIPLESVMLDIPYMQDYADFKVDEDKFGGLKEFTQKIQSKGQKMVVIVDAGLSALNPGDKYYRMGYENDLLIRSSMNPDKFNGAIVTDVWPEHTVFLDFFNQSTMSIWGQGMCDLYEQVPFNGVWLDMNEVTGFCNGECPDGRNKSDNSQRRSLEAIEVNDDEEAWYLSYTQDTNSTYFLPFIPGRVNLDNMSLSLNATHTNGETEFNLHSLFGLAETKMTRDFFVNDKNSPLKDERPFILSRSTFAGSGAYAAHWLGDNHREWDDIKYSIAGMMNFNMFGIPLVGPDTCGFFEGRTMEALEDQFQICGRWMQLATFQPFGRHHRDKSAEEGGRGGERNEPWLLPEPYKTWAINAINDRMQYLRQLYTCLHDASESGQTCFDPLFFHYPTDNETFENIEHSFIYANALKVTPVLKANATTVKSYFPEGNWVSVNNLSEVVVSDCQGQEDCMGQWIDLNVTSNKTDRINAHIMPGTILSFQDNSQKIYNGTNQLNKGPISFIANRDKNGEAFGKLYMDDGISLSQLEDKQFQFYEFHLSNRSIQKFDLNEENQSKSTQMIDKIVIANASDLKNIDFACYSKQSDFSKVTLVPKYDSNLNALTFDTGSDDMIDPSEIRDVYFGKSGEDMNFCDMFGRSDFYHTKDFGPVYLNYSLSTVTLVNTNPAYRSLKLTLSVLENGSVRVFWNYADRHAPFKTPFQVPEDVVDTDRYDTSTEELSTYVFADQQRNKPFELLIRNKEGVEVFNLDGMALSEYFNSFRGTFTTKKSSKGLMGLFERTSNDLFLKDGVYSLWSRDVPNPVENGKPPGKNLYGSHPVVMGMATDNSWFGMYSNNAAAQDWWIKNNADGTVVVDQLSTGGLGELLFFFGANPNEVVIQYHKIVGFPVLTPQWALGWNQCRYGYENASQVNQSVQNYKHYDLPLDTQWVDIDYMDRYRDFTYDNSSFEDLPKLVDQLHAMNKKFIPIIDIGIAKQEDYPAYAQGVLADAFIKGADGNDFVGRVWPGDAVYPDFFAPKNQTAAWWKDQLSEFYKTLPFDGLWLDMNEASNFCDGACLDSQKAKDPVKYKLPYTPTGRDLESKSISLDAYHYGNVSELDAHSLIGTMEAKVTHDWFKAKKMRSMIIERSSFAGIGKYASRWLGDNFSNEQYMGYSVVGVQAHSIMGVPLAGADICGFLGDTNPELCARWHIVGAFYPFSRNHNDLNAIDQEPWKFTGIYDKGLSYLDIIRYAIKTKYCMIKYYYTEISMLNEEGGAFYKPLFFEFPNDAKAYDNQQNNVMLGKAVKLSVLSNTLNQNTTEFYFPVGTWCSMFEKGLGDKSCFTTETGQTKMLSTFAFQFYAHIRAGYIIPFQEAHDLRYQNTADLQQQKIDIHVNPLCFANDTCVASGRFLNDDGETLETAGNRNVYTFKLQGEKGDELEITFNHTEKATNYTDQIVNQNDFVNDIHIYNAAASGLGVTQTVTIDLKDGGPLVLEAHHDTSLDRSIIDRVDQAISNIVSITLRKK